MGRFLLYISYIGTRYSGIQRQTKFVGGKPIITVESVLQEAITALCPANDFRICLSSRTDKGVHAIKNACHVDLTYPKEGKEYDPAIITTVLNYHLQVRNEDVRVLQTKRVPDRFHSRFFAKERKYIYRLAHSAKADSEGIFGSELSSESFRQELQYFRDKKSYKLKLPFSQVISTLDANKVTLQRYSLDIDKLISAADLLSGIHNFTSFTPKVRNNAGYVPHPVKLLTIGVKRGQPFGYPLQRLGYDMTEDMEFWDIHIRGKSFLYKQVRRMVAAMVLVARDVISLEDLRDLLENPTKEIFFSCQFSMPESGLFLTDVEYDPKELEFIPEQGIDDTLPPSLHHDAIQSGTDSSHDIKLDDSDSDGDSVDYNLQTNSNHATENGIPRNINSFETIQVKPE